MKKKLLTLLLALVAIATTGRAQNKINGHEYVDLGLPSGTLWATCNVGASKPEEYGNHFAWGETSPKEDYTWDTYQWYDNGYTKYNGSDGKTELDLEDDAANANWGGDWQMPSLDQMKELVNQCTWEWETLNGAYGRRITGPNGNSIFLPAAGWRSGTSLNDAGTGGGYWSRMRSTIYSNGAYHMQLGTNEEDWDYYSGRRSDGQVIRAVVMKKQNTTLLLNAENFPDANFRAALASILGISEGDEITETKIAAITSINVSSKKIANLTGIEHFTALTWLQCGYNQLTSLDVSKNTALEYLDCNNNQLTSLDVSKNTALTNFICQHNQLTVLDVSQNTALTSLICRGNKLTSLDVSKNLALKSLGGQINQLTSLDVSKNTALTWLECSRNQLSSLDLSQNTALTSLDCQLNQLTSLNISKSIALKDLDCSCNQLSSLDVSQNTALTSLSCWNNKLTSLDISKNVALTGLECSRNQLNLLDVSKNIALKSLSCGSNQLSSLDVSKNTALTRLHCYSNLINGAEMDALVEGMPIVESGDLFIISTNDVKENNVCTKTQVAVAKAKGWTVFDFINGGSWVEYEGSEDATVSLKIEPTEIDFGVVESGSSKTKTFTVTNTGKSELTFYADACTQFTYSFDVSDNQTDVTLAPGASKTYTVTAHGMSAGYEASTNILIKIDGVTEDQKVNLKAFGDDDQPLIDKTSLKMVVGEKASVKIKTGSVSAVPYNDNIVDWIGGGPGTKGGPIACKDYDSSISHQQMGITLTALKVGVVHITFTDLRTNKTATLTVTVTDGSDDESGWQLVTDSGEKFPMSRVGMLVAVDESAYFSVLDTNGNVLADEVLRVHFVNSDPVSVENITTEKTQNILKRYVDNELTLVGANGTVNVYSVDGVKVATTYAAGQETIINVSSLPSGIYIVKCGNQSFKFNKK